MALKRPTQPIAAFSMASMTDVVFLLLIFFMVTSTYVFPTAIDVTLPESSEQTAIKPGTRVFIDSQLKIYASTSAAEDDNPREMTIETLLPFLQKAAQDSTQQYIAIYADESVPYGKLVEVLNIGASNNLKMVLATKPAPASLVEASAAAHSENAAPAANAEQQ